MMAVLWVAVFVAISQAQAQSDSFSNWFVEQREEVAVPAILQPSGSIPEWLEGIDLFRAGPTVFTTPKRNFTNFIDGFGKLARWSFQKDHVTFQQTIIKSNFWNETQGTDIPAHIMLEKSDPPFKKINNRGLQFMDNTDVEVYKFPSETKLMHFTDFWASTETDIDTMSTIGPTLYNDDVSGMWSSSHAAEYTDPASNEQMLVNWLGSWATSSMKLQIYKMGKDRVRHIVGSTKISFLPYSIHSISLAGDYAMVVVGPVELDFIESGMNECISCSTKVHLDKWPTRIYTFSLLATDPNTPPVSVTEIPPPNAFFSFHQLNAALVGEKQIDLDLCAYTSMDGVLGENVLGNFKDATTPSIRDTMSYGCSSLKRLSINIETGELLSSFDFPLRDKDGHEYHVELASPNPTVAGKKYCYVYAPANHLAGSSRYEDMGVVKIDLCGGQQALKDGTVATTTTVTYYKEDGIYWGEPLFVPNPTSATKQEDDGVLLVMSFDGAKSSSFLNILEAKTMTMLAKIKAPFHIPFEFHGRYFYNEL